MHSQLHIAKPLGYCFEADYRWAQPWRDQFRFDVEAGTIAEGLTTAPSEALVALAVYYAGEAGLALTEDLAKRHPAPRMRVTALRALASREPGVAERGAVWARGLDDPDAYVAGYARRALFDPNWI